MTDDHDFMSVNLSRSFAILDPKHNLLVGRFTPIMQRKNGATAGEDAREYLNRMLVGGIGCDNGLCFTIASINDPRADEYCSRTQRAKPRKETQGEAGCSASPELPGMIEHVCQTSSPSTSPVANAGIEGMTTLIRFSPVMAGDDTQH